MQPRKPASRNTINVQAFRASLLTIASDNYFYTFYTSHLPFHDSLLHSDNPPNNGDHPVPNAPVHRSHEAQEWGLLDRILDLSGGREFCMRPPQEVFPMPFAPESFEPCFRCCHLQTLLP